MYGLLLEVGGCDGVEVEGGLTVLPESVVSVLVVVVSPWAWKCDSERGERW